MAKFRIGDYLYWEDPDNDGEDTPGTVEAISTTGNVYTLRLDTGGTVLCFEAELRQADPDLHRAR